MTTNTPTKPWRGALYGRGRQRMELIAGETQPLQGKAHNLKVVDGYAWITVNGTDIILRPGQIMHLPRGHDRILISGLNHTALVYETW